MQPISRQAKARLLNSFSRSNPLGEIVSLLIASVFGAVLNVALKKIWKQAYEYDAPTNPGRPGVRWSDALLWGVVAGSAAGIVKVLSRRLADLLRRRR